MTKKTRKPLNDALARQFVYGSETVRGEVFPTTEDPPHSVPVRDLSAAETAPPTDPPHPSHSQQPERTAQESSLMNKLQVEPKEATTRFTVDLPNSMHRKLSILAAKTGRKKAEIVRMLLDEALKEVEE
jgi:hypothetical protein